MPRLNEEDWAEIRKMREATGLSFRALAERFPVSDVAIMKRSKKESWGDGGNANDVANRLAREKAAGIIPNKVNNFAERTASINSAADQKAAILERQQNDWEIHRQEFLVEPRPTVDELLEEPKLEMMWSARNTLRLKNAKTAAEMLRLRHDGERRAYGIADTAGEGAPTGRPLSDFYGVA